MADGRIVADEVVRLRLDLAYDGTAFSGWASQPGQRTVQQTVEAAFATLTGTTGARMTVAGRTDAGVHARGQVCHVDVPAASLHVRPLDQLAHRLRRLLPEDVTLHRLMVAPDGFDARFSAIWRRYTYRICDDSSLVDPLTRAWVLESPHRLEVDAMQRAAAAMRGEHDFAAYCKQRAGATTIRTLHVLDVIRDEMLVTVTAVADAFCHAMVRSLVGALVTVGEGKRPERWPCELLTSATRVSVVKVLPAHGLTLEEVGYPPDDDLAARAEQSRRLRSLG